MCPVCGYDELKKPAANFSICPCCGTEFGYSDAGPEPQRRIHASLRENWMNRGAIWHSQYTAPPRFWNPWAQLANAKMANDIPWLEGLTFTTPTTYTKVVYESPERKWAAA